MSPHSPSDLKGCNPRQQTWLPLLSASFWHKRFPAAPKQQLAAVSGAAPDSALHGLQPSSGMTPKYIPDYFGNAHLAAGPPEQEGILPEKRQGPLWDAYRKLESAGWTVDGRDYSTAFRVRPTPGKDFTDLQVNPGYLEFTGYFEQCHTRFGRLHPPNASARGVTLPDDRQPAQARHNHDWDILYFMFYNIEFMMRLM